MTVSYELRLAIAAHYSEQARSIWLSLQLNDWSVLVREAIRSRLAPLLYDSLQKFPRQDVPAQAMQHLREVYLATGARNMTMLHQFKRVTDVLDAEGIRWIPLKGAALIQDVYGGNAALRPMSDVDVLVDLVDFATARNHFISKFNIITPKVDTTYITHHLKLLPSNNVCVELHSRIIGYEFYASRPTFDELWKARGDRLGLSTEQQFAHLCAHNYLHHDDTISNFGADAAFVCQQVEDWSEVARFATMNDMVRPLQQGIEMLQNDWFTATEADDLQHIKPSRRENLFVYSLKYPLLKLFLRWWYIRSVSLKFHYAWRLLFPVKA